MSSSNVAIQQVLAARMAALELGPVRPAGQASIGYLADIRALISELAVQAGLDEPAEFAHSFHLLMKGSIITAAEGDTEAAGRAKALARCLLDQYRDRAPEGLTTAGGGSVRIAPFMRILAGVTC